MLIRSLDEEKTKTHQKNKDKKKKEKQQSRCEEDKKLMMKLCKLIRQQMKHSSQQMQKVKKNLCAQKRLKKR